MQRRLSRSPAAVLWLLFTVVLSVLFIVLATSVSPERDVQVNRVSVVPPLQNATETATRSAMKPSRVVSVNRALVESEGSEDELWRELEIGGVVVSSSEIGEFYRTVSLNEAAQRKLLNHAPMEFTKRALETPVIMTLPMPNGTFARFRVEESPVMEARLAAHSPDIRTYRGRGVDDPTATTRFDVTPAGFHAIVLSSKGTVIVEPASHGSRGQYVTYDQSQAPKEAGSLSCLLLGAEQALQTSLQSSIQSKQLPRRGDPTLGVSSGTTLRTYRLALAATAEFTQTFGGGTIDGALTKMTTMINGVNAIYERDLSIRLVLVDNEASIIFTNPATDGYTSDDVNSMLTQNHAILNQRIGSFNYDLGMVLDGHVYNFVPGRFIFQGAAQFQSVCDPNQKGKAVTVLRSTEPTTILAISIAAHELGHMLGALHTLNGTLDDCRTSRFPENAYEPGTGSTIMGFRGGVLPNGVYFPLCDFEDLRSTDTYFHTASIEQIFNFTTSGSVCGSTTATGNNAPNVDAGGDYTIPANTPFSLTATGNDPDADALTYCWEEFDLGAAGPPHTDNGNRPIFRSFAPTPNPTRIFPQLADILSGISTFGESLPTTNRTMNFRVTARDNHPGGGGVNTGAMRVNVVSSSGPFVVTQPNSNTTWQAGSNQVVTWNVANTSNAPVNCANVRVRLSVDGGISFPFTLVSSTPNNGAATISLPNTPTSSARIKVEAIDNIFFNISLPNFTITPSTTAAPTLVTEQNTNRARALDSVTFMRDFFPVTNLINFSLDQRTRVMLFAVGLELLPGEDISVVTAQAENSAHQIFPLTIEYVGKVHGLDLFTQVNVRLPDGIAGAGDVLVSIKLRGVESNKVLVGIQ